MRCRDRSLAVAALLGVGTACGSSGDDDADDDVASLDDGSPDAPDDDDRRHRRAPSDPEDAMLAYTECMRDHGIDMPDPQMRAATGGGRRRSPIEGDLDDEEFQAAQEACEPIMEDARGDIEIDPERAGRDAGPDARVRRVHARARRRHARPGVQRRRPGDPAGSAAGDEGSEFDGERSTPPPRSADAAKAAR